MLEHLSARAQRAATSRSRTLRLGALSASTLFVAALLGSVPTVVGTEPSAHAAGAGQVYIDEPLQSGSLAGWSLQGAGNESNGGGGVGASWMPKLTTVADNNLMPHSYNTNACGVGVTTDAWPKCTASYNAARDSRWLTLTSDDTNNGGGQAGTALHNTAFSSALGVVLEYDQRVYRTNNGKLDPNDPGTPRDQGGGDGIGVYLTDANPPNYGNAGVDTTPGEAGGYGAGLGYSAVSRTGDAWCSRPNPQTPPFAQQGVPGGYIGVGFDVYGNYQKAEKTAGFARYHRATRPFSVAYANPESFVGVDSSVRASRIPQSIGLRGSGVRYTSLPGCDAGIPGGMNQAYGMLQTTDPLVTTAGFRTVFQVKWVATDPVSWYVGDYRANGTGSWVTVAAQAAPENLLPVGFNDSRGYVMFQVPDAVASFDFRYRVNGAPEGNVFSGVAQDVSLGTVGTYTNLHRMIGGYRWLSGTKNLSAYGNPATEATVNQNDAALRGAVIDNVATDATDYRRVRITVTPDASGSRDVTVFWTDKLDVADDVCFDSAGAVIPGVSTTGGTDTCATAGGTWRYGQPYVFEEQFSYDLAASSFQADLPAQFRLGFSASTGWAVNFHQIRNLRVTSVLDLAVEKKVQATGAGTSITPTAWADGATVRTGENVAYRITAWNNGLSDLDPAYPATLTDGLDAVPFEDLADVTWTAVAEGDAQICTAWAATTCTTWATSATGTGPLTDAAPLRWSAPAQSSDPDARVVVTFHGQVGTATAPGTYPNTAAVATSPAGGPQEDIFSNNTDTAEITVLPGWSVTKTAAPASGSFVDAGDTITYTVAATALSAATGGDVAGVTVTDSLAEVSPYADFVAGSLRVDGAAVAAPVVVTEPTAGNGHVLTVAGLDLPAGTTVALTYDVVVKTPATPSISFRNYVIGDKPGNPPVQCAADTEPDYLTACSTQHRTPALMQVLKVGENTAGTVVPFDGSEWAIYPDNNGEPGATALIEFGPAPKSPAIDTGLFQGTLPPGAYWLREEKALDGFSLLAHPVAFTVAADGSVSLAGGNSTGLTACAVGGATGGLCDLVPSAHDDVPTIVVLDIPMLDLPEAGGRIPAWVFFAGGASLLVLIAGVGTLLRRHRREES